jgi:hypothetical protein
VVRVGADAAIVVGNLGFRVFDQMVVQLNDMGILNWEVEGEKLLIIVERDLITKLI